MDKVLIITHTNDNNCVATVSEAIRKNGGEAIRMDVNTFPTGYAYTANHTNSKTERWMDTGDQQIPLHECNALWFRRFFDAGAPLAKELDPEYLQASLEETRRTLLGMIEGFDGFTFGTHSQYRRLDSREEQMKIAVANGLLIPDTLITNSPTRVRSFIEAHPDGVITKMQSAFAIYREGVEHVVFTNKVGLDDLEGIEGLELTPMMFQQMIPKKLELRITIVGDKVFCFAIDSQKSEKAQTDWRKDGVNMLSEWFEYPLPENIEKGLLGLMDYYQINYGAIDVILTPDDKYYFLEINSAGEFFWLDMLCEYKISDQIAKVLLGKAFRRDAR
jgi:hypothetical protein